MRIAVAGGGAFGTALAVALAAKGEPVTLWLRDPEAADRIAGTRETPRLPGVILPPDVRPSADPAALDAGTVLLAIPAQQLRPFLEAHAARLDGRALVACAKGIDLETLTGPTALIEDACPAATPAVLTGPSFAADIARGLPTALTLACENEELARRLQTKLSTDVLRLYRTTDTIGAEFGGAVKNVMAIACGAVTGAGLGNSARAALMTRGYAEMLRLATARGARAETLAGLSGFGDLTLTCTSDQSRNYRFGMALGRGEAFDASVTVEGAATARAVDSAARTEGLDLPITRAVVDLIDREHNIEDVMGNLLARSLKTE